MKAAQSVRPRLSLEQIENAMALYLRTRGTSAPRVRPRLFVGMRITARPYANADWDGFGFPPLERGTVIYVHPAGRYVRARFRIGRAWIEECFLPDDVWTDTEGREKECGIISRKQALM